MIHILRSGSDYWTGTHWSADRGAAQEYRTSAEASAARGWLESDRDVVVVRVAGNAVCDGGRRA